MRLRWRLRGDCHTHSFSSDGGSSIWEMADAARSAGPRVHRGDRPLTLTLTIKNIRRRQLRQVEEIEAVNARLAADAEAGAPPFRVLSGIEVDINEDGTLDQSPEVLAALDIVVGSVHSKLRSPSEVMTKRMLTAMERFGPGYPGPLHRPDRRRPRSSADAVRSRRRLRSLPEPRRRRRDQLPPRAQGPAQRDLLKRAVDLGCRSSIDTDAHAPAQLEWQYIGCDRAAECGITADQVINTASLETLLSWTAFQAATSITTVQGLMVHDLTKPWRT